MLLRHRRPNELPTSLFPPPPPPPATFRKSVPHARVFASVLKGRGGGRGDEIPDRPWRPFNYLFVFSPTSTSRPCHPHAVKGRKGETGKNCRPPRPRLVRQRKEKKKIIAWCQTVSREGGGGVNEECQLKEKQEQDVFIDLRRLGVNSVHLVPFFGGVFRNY